MAEKTIISVSLNNDRHKELIDFTEEVTESFSGNRSKAMREIIRRAMESQSENPGIGIETIETVLEDLGHRVDEVKAILIRMQRDETWSQKWSELEQQPETPAEIPKKYASKLDKLKNL